MLFATKKQLAQAKANAWAGAATSERSTKELKSALKWVAVTCFTYRICLEVGLVTLKPLQGKFSASGFRVASVEVP